jgi:excisionase family DNA binding protein
MTRQIDATRDATERDTMTLEAAAERLGVSLRTVQRRIKDGQLHAVERDGKRFVYFAPGATEGATRDATARQIDATNRDTRHDSAASLVAALLTEKDARIEALEARVSDLQTQAERLNDALQSAQQALLREQQAHAEARQLHARQMEALPPAVEGWSTPTQEPARSTSTSSTPPRPEPHRSRAFYFRQALKIIFGLRPEE